MRSEQEQKRMPTNWIKSWMKITKINWTLDHVSTVLSFLGLCRLQIYMYCTTIRQLRSADTRTLVVSRTCSSFGDRTFAAAGPQVWNSLASNLRLCGLSYGRFRRLLKTFLFGQWGHGAVWTACNCTQIKIF